MAAPKPRATASRIRGRVVVDVMGGPGGWVSAGNTKARTGRTARWELRGIRIRFQMVQRSVHSPERGETMCTCGQVVISADEEWKERAETNSGGAMAGRGVPRG